MKGLVALAFGLLLASSAPLHAETYKWIDANGVTNYSSAPPPSAAKSQAAVALVEERISVIAPDPSLRQEIAAMRARAARNADDAEAEWLQRQQMMAAAQYAEPAPVVVVHRVVPYFRAPYVRAYSSGRLHYTRIAGRPTYR